MYYTIMMILQVSILTKYGIEKEAIERCLSVLAIAKPDEIEGIFNEFGKHNIGPQAIENCLSIFDRAKAVEIKNIFEVYKKHGISDKTAEKSLTVFARGKAKEIDRRLEILKQNGITEEELSQNMKWLYETEKDKKKANSSLKETKPQKNSSQQSELEL